MCIRDSLNRVVALRAQIAGLLGFASHAEGTLKGNMASSPDEVNAFLDRVVTRLKPKRDEDYASLLALKRREVPDADALDPWDTAYFGRQVRESKGIDEEALKPHFPASEVVPATIKALGEDLFGFTVRGPLDDARAPRGRPDGAPPARRALAPPDATGRPGAARAGDATPRATRRAGTAASPNRQRAAAASAKKPVPRTVTSVPPPRTPASGCTACTTLAGR